MFVSGTLHGLPRSSRVSATYDLLKTLNDIDKIPIGRSSRKTSRSSSLSLDWDHIVKAPVNKESKERVSPGSVTFERDTVEFCTKSSYTGKWNALGMTEFGNYRFPHGCEYDGGFEDGRFHGTGIITYPMGQKLKGVWVKGKMISYVFVSVDGLADEPKWEYCKFPDRRFNVEFREGLQPAGRELLTNQQPTRPLADGMCDTGDGYYNPDTRGIIAARDPEPTGDEHLTTFPNHPPDKFRPELVEDQDSYWVNCITVVNEKRGDWIMQNCRKGWDENTGYRPDLYSDWISGRKEELEMLNFKYRPRLSDNADDGDSG